MSLPQGEDHVASGSIVIADESPRSRSLAVGTAQLLIGAGIAAFAVLAIRYQLSLPPGDPDQTTGWIMLGWMVPLSALCLIFAGRNLQRPSLPAAITADAVGIRVRVPRVPFPFAPFQALSDRLVPWQDVRPGFTAGRNARLLVSSSDPASAIPAGQFESPLPEIDAGLRAAAVEFEQSIPSAGSSHTFASSSRVVLLVAGLACVVAGGGALAVLMRLGPVAPLFIMPAVLGFGLIGLGLAPRKRASVDQRGLFVERGRRLDVIPTDALVQGRKEYSRSLAGLFQSGTIDTTVNGKRLRVGFTRVLGLGFPVRELFDVIYRD